MKGQGQLLDRETAATQRPVPRIPSCFSHILGGSFLIEVSRQLENADLGI